jgi:hypothetical protein
MYIYVYIYISMYIYIYIYRTRIFTTQRGEYYSVRTVCTDGAPVGCSYHTITSLHVQIVRVDCIMVLHPINTCLHAHQCNTLKFSNFGMLLGRIIKQQFSHNFKI